MQWTCRMEKNTHAAFKPPLWEVKDEGYWRVRLWGRVRIFTCLYPGCSPFLSPSRSFCCCFPLAIIVALCGYLNVLFSLLFAFQFRQFFVAPFLFWPSSVGLPFRSCVAVTPPHRLPPKPFIFHFCRYALFYGDFVDFAFPLTGNDLFGELVAGCSYNREKY